MVRTSTVRSFGTRTTTAEFAAKHIPPVDHTQEVALQAQRQGPARSCDVESDGRFQISSSKGLTVSGTQEGLVTLTDVGLVNAAKFALSSVAHAVRVAVDAATASVAGWACCG